MAKFLVPIIQKYIDDNNIKTYIEPMCGGANLIDKIEKKISQIVRDSFSKGNYSYTDLKGQIILDLSPYISALTGRHPMILPVIMEVKQN